MKKSEHFFPTDMFKIEYRRNLILLILFLVLTIVLIVLAPTVHEAILENLDKGSGSLFGVYLLIPAVTFLLTIWKLILVYPELGSKGHPCWEHSLLIKHESISTTLKNNFYVKQEDNGYILVRKRIGKCNLYVFHIKLGQHKNAYKKVNRYRKQAIRFEKKKEDKHYVEGLGFVAIIEIPHHFSIKRFFYKNIFQILDCDMVCFKYPDSNQLQCYYFCTSQFCTTVLEELEKTL